MKLRAPARGLVPIYEEHETRLERGINIQDWMRISETEKALMVAVRRTHQAISNLQAEAEIRHTEREARKRRK